MDASTVTLEAVDTASARARSCLERYYEELRERFEEPYDPERHREPSREAFLTPNGRFLVALSEGRAVGCGGVTRLSAGEALITRMWVAPQARGLGLGRRILRELEAAAVELGFRRVRLDTNRALVEARKLYLAAGYREVEAFNDSPYADFWFEKEL
jgi:GNAT superfamily N-acetyltransferase